MEASRTTAFVCKCHEVNGSRITNATMAQASCGCRCKKESAIKACPLCHSQWALEWRLKPEQAVLIVQRADVEHSKDMPDHHARYSCDAAEGSFFDHGVVSRWAAFKCTVESVCSLALATLASLLSPQRHGCCQIQYNEWWAIQKGSRHSPSCCSLGSQQVPRLRSSQIAL